MSRAASMQAASIRVELAPVVPQSPCATYHAIRVGLAAVVAEDRGATQAARVGLASVVAQDRSAAETLGDDLAAVGASCGALARPERGEEAAQAAEEGLRIERRGREGYWVPSEREKCGGRETV